jgi:hypothetical protein
MWGASQIIIILKPGNPPNLTISYQPITLLPIVSKVFEKLFIQRLPLRVSNNRLISSHQYGFRQRHSTTEQTHQIIQRTNEAPEISTTILLHF